MQKPFETRPFVPVKYKPPQYCGTCSNEATTEALFRLENCIVIQRYCDSCASKAEYDIDPSAKRPSALRAS